jgi:hypothetical protein
MLLYYVDDPGRHLKRRLLELDSVPDCLKASKVVSEHEDGAREARDTSGEDYWLKYIKPVLKSLQKEKYRVSIYLLETMSITHCTKLYLIRDSMIPSMEQLSCTHCFAKSLIHQSSID